ncbi:Platelet-derived growth factor receptor alpha like [Actinidia chinensis var. chinensis]|uniref:Platelet-derived growth factor receptor alpha like n=1 Tax=Actinidia chinensis var. chinensis TaxID=1590841 RepID=A0A2R6QYH6_ACTCC|nr:Platelet-derived growth factor receptor alpha like [Actinidia chinensis var. chinensis]
MLFAVEGGGFFSSSASGYSKGLTLLLLGQKSEEKPMRVSPWNQYQLVDQDSDPDLQLASRKNRLVRACTSFVCFGSTAAGLEGPSPLKVGPHQDTLPGPQVSDKGEDHNLITDLVNDDSSKRKLALKGSLKKPTSTVPVSGEVDNEREALCEKGSDISHMERRKVQWMDTSGGELAEIREFEPSDVGDSDDEFDNGSEQTCSCKIM